MFEDALCSRTRYVRGRVMFEDALCSRTRYVRGRVMFEDALCSRTRYVRGRVMFEGALCSRARYVRGRVMLEGALCWRNYSMADGTLAQFNPWFSTLKVGRKRCQQFNPVSDGTFVGSLVYPKFLFIFHKYDIN